jgi:hypothetical protein
LCSIQSLGKFYGRLPLFQTKQPLVHQHQCLQDAVLRHFLFLAARSARGDDWRSRLGCAPQSRAKGHTCRHDAGG